jgi:ribosomal protein S18 acetylase RimI-like enzyme
VVSLVCKRAGLIHILQEGFMEYSIVKVDRDNYQMFNDMVFQRINGREKNEAERVETQNFDTIYETLNNENLFVFAALFEDKFVGWISLVYIPKVGRTNGKGHLFIDELYVDPAYRNKGVAKALVKKGDVLSKGINALGLRLYVNTANDDAISLYEQCG